MHVCHAAVCLRNHSAGEVPRASVEAPWAPASLVPGPNPAARAARTGSSGAAARAKASNGWGGSLPSGVGGSGHSVIPAPRTTRTQEERAASSVWLSRTLPHLIMSELADASGKSVRLLPVAIECCEG